MGRASLFTFIAQYGLYVAFIGRLRLPYTTLWPMLFLASIVLLSQGAAVWDGFEGNRFLTVGILLLLQRNGLRAGNAQIISSNSDLLPAQSGHC